MSDEVKNEEIEFDAFDLEHLSELRAEIERAQQAAQGFLNYLSKKHKLDGPGWSIGKRGFVRQLPQVNGDGARE